MKKDLFLLMRNQLLTKNIRNTYLSLGIDMMLSVCNYQSGSAKQAVLC